ncbi:hypothetical protein [Roseovarius sp.]|uniref:hypothetical protein n=1 Tax=Roseovarius sp. TaxID=1486281 RepID=UPI003A971639
MHSQSLMTDTIAPQADYRPRCASHGHVCRAETPFAQLSIGTRNYEIAEATGEIERLAFRAEGQQEWCALDRRVTEGWVEISSDILLLDPDVLFDFLHTHALRISTAQEPPYEMRYDTLGIKWTARLLQDRDGEVCFEDGIWHYARLGLRAPSDGRERAIMVLLAAIPDARLRFEPHITEWAHRIARGVRVIPIM